MWGVVSVSDDEPLPAEAEERLEGLMGEGGIQDCGKAQNCVQVCPKEIPLTTSIADMSAQVTKKVLDAAGIESYPKTSGSTGIHIYFPLGAKYTYEHSKEFARIIVTRVHAEIPDYTTIERAISDRNSPIVFS